MFAGLLVKYVLLFLDINSQSNIILQRTVEIPVICRFCVHSLRWKKIIIGQELKNKSGIILHS